VSLEPVRAAHDDASLERERTVGRRLDLDQAISLALGARR
jgi:hypothetical protein